MYVPVMPTSQSTTSLYLAVYYNDISIAKHLLDTGIPVDERDQGSGLTPLYAAVLNDNLEMAKMLLDAKADPNVLFDDESTVLHAAVIRRLGAMVDLLLLYGVQLINQRINKTGKTALYLAVESQQINVVRLLLNNGASVNMSTIQNHTLLHVALNLNDEPLARLIADQSCICVINSMDLGMLPLHLAVNKGYREVVKILIHKGANVNQVDASSVDPLKMAMSQHDLKMIDLLLQSGAVINPTVHRQLLGYAVSLRLRDIAIQLLDSGWVNIHDIDQEGLMPLHSAAMNGDVDMAEICLNYGADPNALSVASNMPPLYYAIMRGHRRMVELLLDRGAEPEEWICECCTLLDMAVLWRLDDIATLLMERGALANLMRTDDEEGLLMVIRNLARFVECNSNLSEGIRANLEGVCALPYWGTYYELCEIEIQLMRKDRIFGNVTYYDLLNIKGHNHLALYGSTKELDRVFADNSYKDKYPIYAKTLSYNYTQARVRVALMAAAEERFENHQSYGLPSLCARQVLRSLSNKDIKNFIRGVCDCADTHTCCPVITIKY